MDAPGANIGVSGGVEYLFGTGEGEKIQISNRCIGFCLKAGQRSRLFKT
jgi:hypothetical protein